MCCMSSYLPCDFAFVPELAVRFSDDEKANQSSLLHSVHASIPKVPDLAAALLRALACAQSKPTSIQVPPRKSFCYRWIL